ncbi:hypothetical protein STRCI_002441 [Streptomyces cinnabarinus]|uniref:Lipoprotein n=1 Tax=Streptomyces cinnabarinus TaxID=67287 RepID=A0ABY7KA93_9ACTN|nr:hypothetical protein [Streptomyces cinnabarinus]WAZ21279.1 hypothetical protein STRCI_002441 [Streptomyces cinnabarinus]
MKVTRPMLVAVAALVLAGCGSGGAGDDQAAVPETASGSLEQLAAEVKCAPDIQIDADDIRQAICKDDDGKFILATFATDRGQREWINGAKDYGGHYLVGRKWVAVGDETSTLTVLRKTLGGDLEEGTDHTVHEGGHDKGH